MAKQYDDALRAKIRTEWDAWRDGSVDGRTFVEWIHDFVKSNAHPPASSAENGRVGELRAELTRIADDYHPDRPQDAALALDEMREAIRALLAKASPQ
jgi:hypothetical protein